MGIRERLTKLEAAQGGSEVIIWRNAGETAEQAKARWISEHGGEDPEAAGKRVMIVGWGPVIAPNSGA
jgi:hypothetical protein